MKVTLNKFWAWYERYYKTNVLISALLLVFQLVHLYWLSAHVVALRLTGESYFELTTLWELAVVFVDYIEIPTIIGVSLIYINELRKNFALMPAVMFLLLNSQWFHIFWITDEFVAERLIGSMITLPAWLAWFAISIDYLELPVMFDTVRRSVRILLNRD